MVLMSAAFRDRLRRAIGDAEPEPPSFVTGEADTGDGGTGDDEVGEWLAYELHEWSLESRVMLQQLLVVDKVVHSWQGTTLMVHESLEETVDSLVDEVEETERAKEATTRPIGPEDSLTAFELAEWPEALRAELLELLVQARVPHVLDTEGEAAEVEPVEGEPVESGAVEVEPADVGAAEGEPVEGEPVEGEAAEGEVCDLLVREADEERVELLIDDLLAREEEAQFEELDGLEVNELLSALFVACDRLRRDPGDVDGMRGVLINARRIAGVRTPFGFSSSSWRDLRYSVGELLDLAEGQETDMEDLREMAHRMSDTLRTLI